MMCTGSKSQTVTAMGSPTNRRSCIESETRWFTSRYPVGTKELKACILRIWELELDGGLTALAALRAVRQSILDGSWQPAGSDGTEIAMSATLPASDRPAGTSLGVAGRRGAEVI